MRAALFRSIREFFYIHGFLEVDTPIRQPVCIPEGNIVPLMADGHYLQSSPELLMKRLLAAGSARIFQICHCFRGEECGRFHLREFRMLEWYRINSDYTELMDDCENLLRHVCTGLVDSLTEFDGVATGNIDVFKDIDLYSRWLRLTVAEAFERFSPVPLTQALAEDIFDELLVEHVEPKLGFDTPLFLHDYPVELASLARKKPGEPAIAERFELYIKGVELANGFSELTDGVEQRARFVEEIEKIEKNGRCTTGMPEKFLSDLDLLESAAGIALGCDRLFMLALGLHCIDDAVSFSEGDF